jgi:hypothetical protein
LAVVQGWRRENTGENAMNNAGHNARYNARDEARDMGSVTWRNYE